MTEEAKLQGGKTVRWLTAAALTLGTVTPVGTGTAHADTQIKGSKCSVAANAPHWSKRGVSVIFKTRIECGTTHKTSYDGSFGKTGGRLKETMYTPDEDQASVTKPGRYYGKSTCDFRIPRYSTVKSDTSITRDVEPTFAPGFTPPGVVQPLAG